MTKREKRWLLEELIRKAMARNQRYAEMTSDHPQVLAMQNSAKGAVAAYRNVLDYLKGDAVLLKMDARPIVE